MRVYEFSLANRENVLAFPRSKVCSDGDPVNATFVKQGVFS